MGKLNAKSVDAAPQGRHGDGDGLYLVVKPSGRRSWVLRVQQDGRRRDIGLGSIAKLSLKEAREEAVRVRKHALNGRDPIIERDRLHFTPKTFREATVAVHEAKAKGWADKTADSFLTTLEDYAYPVIGDLLVEHIDAADVVRALRPIWHDKPAVAAKVRQRIGTVLSYSKASKWRTTEAPAKSVAVLLGKRPEGGEMAAMAYADVPAFFSTTSAKADTAGRLALMFLIATAARSGEVRAAAWDQIDLNARLWARPASIMKTRKAHVVTLNETAIAVLKRAAAFTGKQTGAIFPSPRGNMLSDMTVSKVMRDAKLPYVPHGFRSSFRDWAAEAMPTIPDAVAEAALAHAVPDKVERAYKRATFLQMRRKLLDEWGAYLAGKSNVIAIGASR